MKIIYAICVFCLLSGLGRADRVRDIIERHKQTQTAFSIMAVDAQTGAVLYQRNPDRLMIPASNMKLITSSAAMHYLGGSYTFKTKVGLLGSDLVVVGGGDPLLADPKNDSCPSQAADALMNKIVSVLKEADVERIDNIIVDVSFFDNNRVHPSWPKEQLNQWYACETSGLNFYNNCIHLEATRRGQSAVLTMTPENNYIDLHNQVQVVSKGSSAIGAYRNSVPNKLLVKGKLNQAASFDVAIENPAGLLASILKNRLQNAGITVGGQLLQRYVKQNETIRYLVIFETPIADVLKRCNTNSLGLAAECLVKTISAENTQGNINGEWPHGLNLISRYLQSLDIPNTHYVLDDGSGLSRNNRLSADCLIAVLKDMYQSKDAEIFISSLAVGGLEGTAEKFFQEAPYRGTVFGKTGYIAGVRSFSGICRTPQGDILFSILTEGGSSTTRTCINDITKAIYDRKL
ncbi:MAG: D-alanyl-D-alanine carboxypeptidase/D-alanyl-D-alanine-endopeptidase [Planctomycetales bacterium]|nr:D-alanyl-D-alanine carboxypeptidase/D-alanyl-D-alanine-endopeptidase [Planctomycetales bacterium]